MITKLGIAAGDIWTYLEKHERVALLEDIMSGLGKDRDLVLMSIGWLAREGHVALEGDGPNYSVRLTKLTKEE